MTHLLMGAGRTCGHQDLHHALYPADWVFSKDTHSHHVPSSPPAPTSSPGLFSLPSAGRTSIFSCSIQSPSSHVLPCPNSSHASSIALRLSPRCAPASPVRDCSRNQLQDDGGCHQSAWEFQGPELAGRGPSITRTPTCSKANLYLPLRLSQWRSVRTHCRKGTITGGSPGGQQSPAPAPHASLQGMGSTSGLCPRLVSPYVLQVKNTQKKID